MKKFFKVFIFLLTLSVFIPFLKNPIKTSADTTKTITTNKVLEEKEKKNSHSLATSSQIQPESKNNLNSNNSTQTKLNSKSNSTLSSSDTSQKDSKKNLSSSSNKTTSKNLKSSTVEKISSTSKNKNESKTTQQSSNKTSSANNQSSNDSTYNYEIDEKELTPSDWKISIEDKNQHNNFSSIQKNSPLKNSLNDGQFILVAGIVLVVLSGLGLVTFTLLLIRKNKQGKKD